MDIRSRNTGGSRNAVGKPTITHSHLALVLEEEKKDLSIRGQVVLWKAAVFICSSANQQLYSKM